ncbi:MAG: 16S rRNA (guanine527-N7)-methyltransferase [Arenicella sp.]|jgi:16S rRNA (guanine527-N7)-methyltransferase
MELLLKYFPDLTKKQIHQFDKLAPLYEEWNEKINVVSRKDIENLYERHILHSLAIAKYFEFDENDSVLDIGTGGGFPGIPLAIMFPETKFHLVDSIAKKIKVVDGIVKALDLKNVTYEQKRAEKVEQKFTFAVTRAVARIRDLYHWSNKKIHQSLPDQELKNGLICLKGGDLKEEFSVFKKHTRYFELSEMFEEEFFETKKIVYVPM